MKHHHFGDNEVFEVEAVVAMEFVTMKSLFEDDVVSKNGIFLEKGYSPIHFPCHQSPPLGESLPTTIKDYKDIVWPKFGWSKAENGKAHLMIV